MKKSVEWDLISYVFRSKYRQKIIKTLILNPKTPSQLAKQTEISINHISNVLKSLLDKGLVICLNPLEKRGKFYQITELGINIFDKIKKIETDE